LAQVFHLQVSYISVAVQTMAKPIVAILATATLLLLSGSIFCKWIDIQNKVPVFHIEVWMTGIQISFPKVEGESKLQDGAALFGQVADALSGDKSWALFYFDGTDSFSKFEEHACGVKGKASDLITGKNACTQATAIKILCMAATCFAVVSGLFGIWLTLKVLRQAYGLPVIAGALIPGLFVISVFCTVTLMTIAGCVVINFFDVDEKFFLSFGMFMGICSLLMACASSCIACGKDSADGENAALLNKQQQDPYVQQQGYGQGQYGNDQYAQQGYGQAQQGYGQGV